jgi:hypothetical protein
MSLTTTVLRKYHQVFPPSTHALSQKERKTLQTRWVQASLPIIQDFIRRGTPRKNIALVPVSPFENLGRDQTFLGPLEAYLNAALLQNAATQGFQITNLHMASVGTVGSVDITPVPVREDYLYGEVRPLTFQILRPGQALDLRLFSEKQLARLAKSLVGHAFSVSTPENRGRFYWTDELPANARAVRFLGEPGTELRVRIGEP